ncbi:MAG: hypothetical protein ACREO0_02305, partial [Pseudoxanthomonas sp.]
MQRIAALLLIVFLPAVCFAQERANPAQTPAQAEPQPVEAPEPVNSFSFVRYRADYEVKADATSVETNEYEILIKTKAGVDNFSQVRLS